MNFNKALCSLATILALVSGIVFTPIDRVFAEDLERRMTAFKNANGPFSAMIAIIPSTQLSEFEKPSSEGLYLTPVAKAKVGDIVAIMIPFSGPVQSTDGTINVSYDIKVLSPDGSIYDGMERKNLPAYIGPSNNTNAIFHNVMSIVQVRFEAKDAPGIYRVEIVLHDNNAKRDIPMFEQVNLSK